MQHEDSIRQSVNRPRQPTSTSVGIPLSSLRKKSMLEATAPATRRSQQFQAQNPQILKDQRYAKIYDQIYKDVRKTRKYFISQQTKNDRHSIKQSIKQVIRLNSEQGEFNDRFNLNPAINVKKEKIVKKQPYIGQTRLEKQSSERKYFFANHKKVLQFEENCMLLEYYLKDQEKQKNATGYLKGLEQTSRHRRLTPTTVQNQKLYLTHNEGCYRSLKKRVHLKQQFVQKCSEFAKKNTSYRRRQNFRKIQYVLKGHFNSVFSETILAEDDQQQAKALQQNNKITKLYLSMQFMLLHHKENEELTSKSLAKFKRDLYTIEPSFQFKEIEINHKIEQIMEFKRKRVLQFQDFKELLAFVSTLYNKDILALFQQKFPDYFIRKKDIVLQKHWHQIDHYFTHNKIKFLLQLMFHTFPEKIIGLKLLQIKAIPAILRAYGISEKDYSRGNLLMNYHWVQKHNAGITFDQFYKGSILMGMKKQQDWKGIQTLLKKINLKNYL